GFALRGPLRCAPRCRACTRLRFCLPTVCEPPIGALLFLGFASFGLLDGARRECPRWQLLAALAASSRRELEPAHFFGIERGAHERIALASREQVPRDDRELAGDRDGRDVGTAP